uniref:F-box associated beta-propeller type 1 domain-containing protein n=1 Tax=Fagus sylvatica TaxID=28930 RepID=A0A2N9H7Y0_FAGSY
MEPAMSVPTKKPKLWSEHVPNELVYDILTQLPVKSLIRFSIFGSCNGMVCLASADERLSHLIYLWNPSIRKFKMLCATPLTLRHECVALGLAYHSQNNDFKILRIVCREPSAEAEIYTLSTDSWRKVVISEEKYDSILSFDVNDEKFQNIMLPQNHLVDDMFFEFQQLAVFKGLLALMVFGKALNKINGICNIWVMKEYAVVESWTKIHVSVDPVNNFYGCNDNNELLIENDTGLVSFDPDSLNQNVLAIEDANWMHYTTNSMESLVLLDGVNVSSEMNVKSSRLKSCIKYLF